MCVRIGWSVRAAWAAMSCSIPRQEDLVARVRSETEGQGANVAITACPAPEAQTQAVGLLAPFGRLCLFGGLPKSIGSVALDTNAIHYGNFLVTGSTGGAADDYRIALRLVANRRIDLSSVISPVRLERACRLRMTRLWQARKAKSYCWRIDHATNLSSGHRHRDAGHEGGAVRSTWSRAGLRLSQVPLAPAGGRCGGRGP